MSTASDTTSSSVIVKCGHCDKAYKIHPEKLPAGISSFPCRACGTLIPVQQVHEELPSAGSQQILVAVEEPELGKLIQRILAGRGYNGRVATSGKEALEAIREGGLDLLLLSVYLPDMMGFELLDRINEEKSGTGLPSILLSSIHHAARYKRAPTSLYGADDYLERHHLPDLLIPKIRQVLSTGETSQARITPEKLPPPTDDQIQNRRDLEAIETSGLGPESPQMGEIQRMCRVIVGDIALYNEALIASTPPEELLDALAGDLSEGEALLLSRFPEMDDQLSHLLRGEFLRLLHTMGIRFPENSSM